MRIAQELSDVDGKAGRTGGGGGIDLLGDCVVAASLGAIAKRFPSIFRPGKLDIFHANFTAAMRLLRELERRFCRTEAQRRRLRTHAATAGFIALWDLQTHFEVRAQSIRERLAAALERAALATGSGGDGAAAAGGRGSASASGSGSGTALLLRGVPARALWSALNACWSPRVALQPLVPHFARLGLELVTGFAEWSDARVVALAATHAAGNRGDERRAKAAVDELAVACEDLRVLADALRGDWEGRARESWVDARVAKEVVVPMMARVATRTLAPLAERCWRQLEASSVAMCQSALLAIKSVPSAFKMQSKPLPTRPSPFLPSITRPLAVALRRHEASIPAARRRDVVENVAALLLREYEAIVAETVARVQRTERSLAKLRAKQRLRGGATRGTGGSSGGGDGGVEGVEREATETEKICRQLLLDAQALGNQLEELPFGGIDLVTSGDFARFIGTVELLLSSVDGAE